MLLCNVTMRACSNREDDNRPMCCVYWTISYLLCILCIVQRRAYSLYTPEFGRRKKQRLVGRYVCVTLTGTRCHS